MTKKLTRTDMICSVQGIFEQYDTNRDNLLSLISRRIMNEKHKGLSNKQMLSIFQMVDKDHNGFITKAELYGVFRLVLSQKTSN